MKISKLIEILNDAKKENGDIEIGIKTIDKNLINTKGKIVGISYSGFEGCNIVNDDN